MQKINFTSFDNLYFPQEDVIIEMQVHKTTVRKQYLSRIFRLYFDSVSG